MQLLLSGVDVADSGGLSVWKEAESNRAGLSLPTQTSNGEKPPSVHQKCFHHLCLKVT